MEFLNELFEGLRRRFQFQPDPAEESAAPEAETPPPPAPELRIYSGMRVEVTGMGDLEGQMLFTAQLKAPSGNRAELHQISSTCLAQDQEPLRVRIRGYHGEEEKALRMEGTISPRPHRVWMAEDLTVSAVSNDRAFFRLDTKLDATVTSYRGPNVGEKPCQLLNISVGGARIRSTYVYQKDDKFLLKVQLLDEREPSMIYCQVLRVIQKDEGTVEYGCRFLDLNEADQDRITENIFAAQRKKRSRA